MTTYIALPCYNKSEKELFCMKWLIMVDQQGPGWYLYEMPGIGSYLESHVF